MRPDDLCYEVLIRRLDLSAFELGYWQKSLAVDGYVSATGDRLKDKSAFILTSGDIDTTEGVANLELNNIVSLTRWSISVRFEGRKNHYKFAWCVLHP
jgi:hypothetical protein